MKINCIMILALLLISLLGCTSSTATETQSLTTSSEISTLVTTSPAIIDWSPDGVIETGEYSGSNSYGEYQIFWRSDEQFIYIGITAKTDGWVAMAIQPGRRMKNADMIIGLVKDGKADVRDHYCVDDFGSHPEDVTLGGTDDILAFGGKEEAGFTTIEFKRLFNTEDKYDVSITKGTNQILWAFGSSDDTTVKHFTRGYGEINP